jgi:hypothetical protein
VLTRPDDLPEAQIRAELAAGWHFATEALSYLPAGFGSRHWLATDAAGRQQLLIAHALPRMLHSRLDTAEAAFARLETAFACAPALRFEVRRRLLPCRAYARCGGPGLFVVLLLTDSGMVSAVTRLGRPLRRAGWTGRGTSYAEQAFRDCRHPSATLMSPARDVRTSAQRSAGRLATVYCQIARLTPTRPGPATSRMLSASWPRWPVLRAAIWANESWSSA